MWLAHKLTLAPKVPETGRHRLLTITHRLLPDFQRVALLRAAFGFVVSVLLACIESLQKETVSEIGHASQRRRGWNAWVRREKSTAFDSFCQLGSRWYHLDITLPLEPTWTSQ